MKRLFLCLALFALVGCETEQMRQYRVDREHRDLAAKLPEGAKVLENNRSWVVFEVNIGGRLRKFLYRRIGETGTGSPAETITELKD